MVWHQSGFQQILCAGALGVWAVQSAAPWGGAARQRCPILTFRTSLPSPLGALCIFALAPFSWLLQLPSAVLPGFLVSVCGCSSHLSLCPVCQGSCPGPRSGLCRAGSRADPAQSWALRGAAEHESHVWEVTWDKGSCPLPSWNSSSGLAVSRKKPSPAFSWILSMSLTQHCIILSCKLTCAAFPQQFVLLCFAPRGVSNLSAAEEWLCWIWKWAGKI